MRQKNLITFLKGYFLVIVQYLPDEVLYEPAALDAVAKQDLERRGHKLALSNRDYGNMQAVLWDIAGHAVSAASDPRGEGSAAVWNAKLPEIKPPAETPSTENKPAKAKPVDMPAEPAVHEH